MYVAAIGRVIRLRDGISDEGPERDSVGVECLAQISGLVATVHDAPSGPASRPGQRLQVYQPERIAVTATPFRNSTKTRSSGLKGAATRASQGSEMALEGENGRRQSDEGGQRKDVRFARRVQYKLAELPEDDGNGLKWLVPLSRCRKVTESPLQRRVNPPMAAVVSPTDMVYYGVSTYSPPFRLPHPISTPEFALNYEQRGTWTKSDNPLLGSPHERALSIT
ncbi:hypothetical protein NMY22_g6957 [Coprinellus aureogranulatus]|nr:hypothetical protein NMY22_g6957 [Coprinellus aureogranulatus]